MTDDWGLATEDCRLNGAIGKSKRMYSRFPRKKEEIINNWECQKVRKKMTILSGFACAFLDLSANLESGFS